MSDDFIIIAGRKITAEDLEHIKWARATYPNLSRTELAGTVCHIIEWLTPAGRAKVQQCLALFEHLESQNILDLPPKRKQKPQAKVSKSTKVQPLDLDQSIVDDDIRELEPIKLDIAATQASLKRWRYCVNQYHILGDKRVFGSRLQYFIKSGERELGCMQISASAYALAMRDRWIGLDKHQKEHLHLIVNQNRFLIFPWVKVKNLATKALSRLTKQLKLDWTTAYGYAPVLLETFVDLDQFRGTCYQAANWKYIGQTKGTGRTRRKGIGLSKKAIYVYPLHRKFRSYLKGELAYQVIDPD